MKYTIQPTEIPQDKRKVINEKILYLIDNKLTEKYNVEAEDIYNSYTGDGGLHGLSFNDFDNFHDYTEAKKEIENGQFFTIHNLCRFIIDCLKPSEHDLIADLTAGMGNFFNWLPNLSNVYGNEIDIKAFKVMRFLYPEVNSSCEDIRSYEPGVKFDLILGNPPFNLKWTVDKEEYLSQFYYCWKAHELLQPGGILALIVPKSFLSDDFTDSGMIKKMNAMFNFIHHIGLPDDAFKSVGVERFETKIMLFQKKSDYIPETIYSNGQELTITEPKESNGSIIFKKYIEQLYEEKEKIRSKLYLENLQSEPDDEFEFKVKKYLFDIKRNSKINMKYAKCREYVNRYYNQVKPNSMKYEEWMKIRITKNKVLSYLKKVLKNQHYIERDEIKLVKTRYGIKLKAYSHKMKLSLSKTGKKEDTFFNMVLNNNYPFEDKKYKKLLNKKITKYKAQALYYSEMNLNRKISNFLDDLIIYDSNSNESIKLNLIQKEDTNKILQKQYGFLQWGQGSGKSVSGVANLVYRLQVNKARNVFIVSTAIAINNTWAVILKSYGFDFIRINTLKDIYNIQPGQIVIVTLNQLTKYQRFIKKFVKMQSQKVALIFDEADNMSSSVSKRTRAILSVFRKVKYKTLMTGTMTRNTIAEAATQFELLYNNSVNMISNCEYIFKRDKDDKEKLNEVRNENYLKPIPAYNKGYRLFSESHIPEKITVFGIGQHTQDVYNADVLKDLINKTIITRSFEEVRGEKIYDIIQQKSRFNSAEKELYKRIIEEFYTMKHLFKSTGNIRKDRMLEILNQLMLMLKVCAAPQVFGEYQSKQLPNKFVDVLNKIDKWEDEYVAIGVRHIKTVNAYVKAIKYRFPSRPVFVITGDKVSLNKRKQIIQQLQESKNGILISTQQSLSSSMNIGFVNKVIIPELSWNEATMSQYYFRFIRYNSIDKKEVHFFTYENSIESNLLGLILTKEKLNLFMKNQEIDDEELYDKFGVDFNLLDMLMSKERDIEGNVRIKWGKQEIS
ncbi:helicase [Paenibacillaceae bacterium]|nr:helicase [Paenibacillaceae bacterium]